MNRAPMPATTTSHADAALLGPALDVVFDEIGDAIARFDAGLRLFYLNRAARQIGDRLFPAPAELARVLASAIPLQFERVVARPNGTLYLDVRALAEGGGRGVVVIGRDVSRERQAEREMQRLTERTARLQATAAALARALTPASVAAVMEREGRAALGAGTATLALLGGEHLTVVSPAEGTVNASARRCAPRA
jgi:hypothetical protein